jgi:hypothetical protein
LGLVALLDPRSETLPGEATDIEES